LYFPEAKRAINESRRNDMKSIGKFLFIIILIGVALSIPCSCTSIGGGTSISAAGPNGFAKGNFFATSASGSSSTLLKDYTIENSAGDSVHLYATGEFIGRARYNNDFKVTPDHVFGTESLKGVGDMIKCSARATNAEGVFAETCAVVASASSENENYIDYANAAWASKDIVWANQEILATGPDALITTHAYTSNLIGVDSSYINANIYPIQRVELEAEGTDPEGSNTIPDILIGRAFGPSAILKQKVINTGDTAIIQASYIYPTELNCNIDMIISTFDSDYVKLLRPLHGDWIYESERMISYSESS
jgi:hypothetical protein